MDLRSQWAARWRSLILLVSVALMAALLVPGMALAIDPDDYETDNALGTAKDYSLGSVQNHTITPMDEDWLKMPVTEGERYIFMTEGVSEFNVDTLLYLYDSEGQGVAGNDDGGVGTYSFIDYTATFSGTLYIQVLGYYDDGQGDYALKSFPGDSLATLSGTVRNSDGDPVSGATVEFAGVEWGSGDGFTFAKSTTTETDGSYTLELPATGFEDSKITVTHDGFSATTTELGVFYPGAAREHDAVLFVQSFVTGAVKAEGDETPVPAYVEAFGFLGDVGTVYWDYADEFGQYAIETPPGDYGVWYSADWYLSEYWQNQWQYADRELVSIAEGETRVLDAFLRPSSHGEPATLSGFVKDPEGNPIAGIDVSAYAVGYEVYEQYTPATQTDETGYYELTFPRSATVYGLDFTSPSSRYAPWGIEDALVAYGGVVTNFSVVLEPATVISGNVVDASVGGPLSDVDVEVFDFYQELGYSEWTSTDENGDYAIQVEPGDYAVSFEKFGLLPEFWDDQVDYSDRSRISLSQGQLAACDAALEVAQHDQPATIGGYVTDVDQNPIEGITVSLSGSSYDDELGSSYSYETTTNAEGYYEITAPESIIVDYMEFYDSDGDYIGADFSELLMWGGKYRSLNLTMRRPGVIAGTVIDEVLQTPVEDAHVEAYDFDGELGYWDYAHSNANGQYSMQVPEGDFRVFSYTHFDDAYNYLGEYWDAQRYWSDADMVTVSPGATATVDIAMVMGASIEGSIRDAEYGVPVTSGYLVADDLATEDNDNLQAQINSDGSYRLDALWGSEYAVTYYSADPWEGTRLGYLDESTTTILTTGQRLKDVDFELERDPEVDSAYVTGWVTNSLNEPLSGMQVYISGTGSITSASGHYRILARVGERTVEVTDPANHYLHASEWVEITGLNDVLVPTMVMKTASTISGQVKDVAGNPIPTGSVSLWRYEAGMEEWYSEDGVSLDETGAYEFKGMAPGEYVISFNGNSGPMIVIDQPSPHYASEFYNDKLTPGSADPVVLGVGTKAVANATLSAAGSLTATLAGDAVAEYDEVRVWGDTGDGWEVLGGADIIDGGFDVGYLHPGAYAVQLVDWDELADPVFITDGPGFGTGPQNARHFSFGDSLTAVKIDWGVIDFGTEIEVIDNAPPSISTKISSDDSYNGWYKGSAKVMANFQDEAGIDLIKVIKDGVETTGSAETTEVAFDTHGLHSVTFVATDSSASKNTATKTVDVKVDKLGPNTPTVTYSAISTDSITLSWSAVDEGAGVGGYTVFKNDVEVFADDSMTSWTDDDVEPGETITYTVEAQDVFGNASIIRGTLVQKIPSLAEVVGGNVPASNEPTTVTFAVAPGLSASVTLPLVSRGGQLTITSSAKPNGYANGDGTALLSDDFCFDVSFTGQFIGKAIVKLPYPADLPPARAQALKIRHFRNGAWETITPKSVDTVNHVVEFEVSSFSPMLLVESDNVVKTVSLTAGAVNPFPVYGTATSLSAVVRDGGGNPLPGYQVQIYKNNVAGAVLTTNGSGAVVFPLGTFTTKALYRVVVLPKTYTQQTISGTIVVHPKVRMAWRSAPTRAYVNRAFTVSGSLVPRHAASRSTSTVVIKTFRKVGTTWRLVSTRNVAMTNSRTANTSNFSASVKLTSRGTWKIQAYAKADAAHSVTFIERTVSVR